jgi:PIN domain nuclease of toxin-antitoxin system
MVLDTHVLLWWLSASANLPARARKALRTAIAKGPVTLSAISIFEIATGVRRGRIALRQPLEDWFQDLMRLPEIRIEPVSAVIATHAAGFDENVHGDPADRIILATASVLGLPLATADEKLRSSKLTALAW